MSAVLKPKPKAIVCDGNEAAAWAVTLARVDMVAVYPITPQSSLVEYLAKFVADGKLNAEIVDVEGEHSVLSVLHGGVSPARAPTPAPVAPAWPSCSSPTCARPACACRW